MIKMLPRHAAVRISLSALVGTVVGVVAGTATPVTAAYGVLTAWLVSVTVYLVWLWVACWHLGAEDTREAARREDPTRPLSDALLLLAAAASLIAVVLVLADAQQDHGAAKALRIGVAILTIVGSWFLVHSLFTTKYARAYYLQDRGAAIDYNGEDPPVWSDFAYTAFTVGMTFQISDTDLRTVQLRRLALCHMLLSYLFGAVIIAVAINTLAGVTQGH
jgi:uncharacterized membrane protein